MIGDEMFGYLTGNALDEMPPLILPLET